MSPRWPEAARSEKAGLALRPTEISAKTRSAPINQN